MRKLIACSPLCGPQRITLRLLYKFDGVCVPRQWNYRHEGAFFPETVNDLVREKAMRIEVVVLSVALIAGPAGAQSTSPPNLKPETNCTTSSVTTGSAGEKKADSMAVEKSAVLPDTGGEANSAAPTVQSAGKPMEVRPDCPPDPKRN
jgi:hypothetical protein